MDVHWIHLRYGIETTTEIIEFNSSSFTLVRDVLERIKIRFRNCSINLYNEHGRQMELDEIVKKARVYTSKRRPLLS